MVLKDTIQGMTSEDYKERFIAEYTQLVIRMRALKNILDDHYNGCLKFEFKTPVLLLEEQYNLMSRYCGCLVQRARIENITLPEVNYVR